MWLLEALDMLADPLTHNDLNNTVQNAQLSACPSQSFIIVSRDNSARKFSVGANKSAANRTPKTTNVHNLSKLITQQQTAVKCSLIRYFNNTY